MPELTLSPAGQLLSSWVQRQAAPDATDWLAARLGESAAGEVKGFYLGFGMASRKMGKATLNLTDEDLRRAEQARAGWNPAGWSVDQAARTLLILALPASEPAAYVEILDRLFAAAEMGEAVALYQALPLLPHPAAHRFRCTEGIRANIKAVFCAVALRNPYPAEQLDEDAWNQLVLKALFVGAPLDQVIGLDRRANATLRQMLVDFACERRAAHRPIPPELWRSVGPLADEIALDMLEQILATGSPLEQDAAALALSASPNARAYTLLASQPDRQSRITMGELNWSRVSEAAAVG